mmetsp:Transcript_49855/g.115785  ORF Transcript_49855/g.115785 Transcript_49855/m.115785 type:complete len:646 (-) Transcript_49855:95-2032(-)
MSAKGDLPPGLSKVFPSLPVDCQVKLMELHGKFHFNDDQLDAFTVNSRGLNADNLPAFQAFLEQELAKSLKSNASSRGGGSGGSQKRKSLSGSHTGVPLPKGVLGAMFGHGPSSQTPPLASTQVTASQVDAQATTPNPKRREVQDSLESNEPASGTPDPPLKPVQVSLKTTVNNGGLAKYAAKAGQSVVKVELLGSSEFWTGPRHGTYSWMDESLEERATARDARLMAWEASFSAILCKRGEEEGELPLGTVGLPTQSEVVLCGRLLCEGLEGRLNERSLLLEGSRAAAAAAVASGAGSAGSVRVQLNVAECKQIAAFPGQIVGVVGRSGMTGTSFHAREFLAGLPPPAALVPRGDGELHVMAMAGPFCLRNGLDYSPLEQALKFAAKERPQVLILFGPFLDAGNEVVMSGETVLPGRNEVCTLDEVYTQHVVPLLTRGLQVLRRSSTLTEVIIVPSLDEVLCFHPLPQPPLDKALGCELGESVREQLERLGVRFVPNPAHLRINEFRVSITSADALSPVLREIVLRPEGRKIDEALRLLLRQRTLFPVLPREPVQVSEARCAALEFPDREPPDVCIFPSLSGIATGTIVDRSLVVNPGSVCRPAALGTFVELLLAPSAAGTALEERVRVDVHKLDFRSSVEAQA